jgi:hypothetical protein
MREDRAGQRYFADEQMRAIDAHEPYEISPGETLFVTPGALLYAQLDIFVSFQPRKVPWGIDEPYRFETRRLSDGGIQWVHIPND